jgi:surface antigen
MKRFFGAALSVGALCVASPALAQPIMMNDDDSYQRLARWEQHLDDAIANRANNGSLDWRTAYRMQKQLDRIEMRSLKAYYDGRDGIDERTYREIANDLGRISADLGERPTDGDRGGYGDRGFGDRPDGDQGYGPPPPPPPQGGYYREGDYERDCHSGNVAAGTIFGGLGGGLIGAAASHGNAGAVVGGVILGGLLGNTLSRDIDCDDHRYAFTSYNEGLNGEIGHRYEWHHGDHYGYFTPTREYRDGPYLCRDFEVITFRDGRSEEHTGTACRQEDENWHVR